MHVSQAIYEIIVLSNYNGKHIAGEALSLNESKIQSVSLVHLITDGKDYGEIRCTKEKWSADKIKDLESENNWQLYSCMVRAKQRIVLS